MQYYFIIPAILICSTSSIANSYSFLTTKFDALLKFNDPRQCHFNEQFEEFHSKLFTAESEEINEGIINFPAQYQLGYRSHNFTRNEHGLAVSIRTDAIWKQFYLYQISSFAPNGGDTPSISLHVVGNYDAVIDTLQKEGVPINNNGKYVDNDSSAYTLEISVTAGETNCKSTTEISCHWL